MVSSNTTIPSDNALKPTSFASGILSALAAGLQSSETNSKLFKELLSQTSSLVSNATPRMTPQDHAQSASIATKTTATLSTNSSDNQNLNDVLMALRKIASQLALSQGAISKTKNASPIKGSVVKAETQTNQMSQPSNDKTNTTNSTASVTDTSTQVVLSDNSSSTNRPPSSNVSATINSNANLPDTTQNLANVIAELQKMVAWLTNLATPSSPPSAGNNNTLDANLQSGSIDVNAGNTGNSSTSPAATFNSGLAGTQNPALSTGVDPTALSSVLQGLLGVAQLLQKQLTTSPSTDLQNVSTPSLSGSVISLNALQLQIASVVDNLKTLVANTKSTSPQIAHDGSIGSVNPMTLDTFVSKQTMVDAVSPPVVATTPSTPTSTVVPSTNTAAMTTNTSPQHPVDNFFNSLSNLFGPATATNAPLMNQGNQSFSQDSNNTAPKPNTYTDNGTSTLEALDPTNNALDPSNNGITPQLMATGDTTKSTNPYSFASQLSASRPTLGSSGLPNAVEQVIFQLNRSVRAGQNQMTLQLQPADLGRISIRLDFANDGKVQGKITADNPATLDLLSKDVGSLTRVLQEAGLHADQGSLQFSLGGQTGNNSNQTASNSSSNSSNSFPSADTVSTEDSNPMWDAQEFYTLTPNRVNLKV